MPCYEVQLTSVVFKAKHKNLLVKALNKMQFRFDASREGVIYVYPKWEETITLDLINEKAVYEVGSKVVNTIKRGYSLTAVEELAARAKKKQWVMKKNAENKFTLKKY